MRYTLIVTRFRNGETVTDRRPYRSYQRACADARKLEDADRSVVGTDVVCVDALDPTGIAVRRSQRDVQGGMLIFQSQFWTHHEAV